MPDPGEPAPTAAPQPLLVFTLPHRHPDVALSVIAQVARAWNTDHPGQEMTTGHIAETVVTGLTGRVLVVYDQTVDPLDLMPAADLDIPVGHTTPEPE